MTVMAPLSHRGTAYAQILLSCLFIGGYFAVLLLFITGNVKVPPEFKDTCNTLLGALTAGVGLILSFWFMRQRESKDGGASAQ